MILPPGTHCSRLSRNGSHISTHTASIPFRWRLVNSVRKYSSSVSFLRSFPNHNGSAVSRLHTTVRNLSFLPRYSSSTPICRNGGFRRRASQRSKYRRSMPRTVLSARPIRRAPCRAEALSQDSPTASSNRLLYGDLLGNCGTFSAFTPHAGQSTRYSSTTTVVCYSKHGRSRISRSYTSCILCTRLPQPAQGMLRFPRLRLIHNLSGWCSSSISC